MFFLDPLLGSFFIGTAENIFLLSVEVGVRRHSNKAPTYTDRG